MVVAVAFDKPVKIPETEPMVPTDVTELLHVPAALPAGEAVNVSVEFWHTGVLPKIEVGVVFTVTVWALPQPPAI